jgi:arylsulfatase A-like enzyme
VSSKEPNIVLIIVDTLRNGTINFQQLKYDNVPFFKEFTIYDGCIAPAPWTIPSHASIFTGKYPSEHGIHEDREHRISSRDFTCFSATELQYTSIFQILKKKGYTNYGITSNINIRPGTVYERGFDVFQYFDFPFNQSHYSSLLSNLFEEFGEASKKEIISKMLRGGRINELINLYTSKHRAEQLADRFNFPIEKGASYVMETITNTSLLKPFSLFLNIMEMHEPYQTPFHPYDQYKELISSERMSIKKVQKIRKKYSAQGEQVKNFLFTFFTHLKETSEWDNTLIIVTSDHGQSLWENGFGGHGTFLYNELIKVPLLIKYPKSEFGKINNTICSSVDLFALIDSISSGDNSELTPSEVSFSESFGVMHSISSVLDNRSHAEKERLENALGTIDFRRISVFKGKIKLTLNTHTGEIIEYLENSKPAEINSKFIKESGIIDNIEIFDSKITIPFR